MTPETKKAPVLEHRGFQNLKHLEHKGFKTMPNVSHMPASFKIIEGNRSILEQIVTKIRVEAVEYPCSTACKMQEIADDIEILVFGKDIERAWTEQQWQDYADAAMESRA